jgi:PII-like signaling protein
MVFPEASAHQLNIYIGESNRWQGQPLYLALLQLARKRGLAGGTVVRAIAGFGRNSRIRSSSLLELSTDLPILITFIDQPEKIAAVLPEVKAMITDGLVTLHPVQILLHVPQRD